MPAELTYGELFGFLRRLGFTEFTTARRELAFWHDASDTLLAFSWRCGEQDRVANADLASTERMLREKLLIKLPITEAIRSATAAKTVSEERT